MFPNVRKKNSETETTEEEFFFVFYSTGFLKKNSGIFSTEQSAVFVIPVEIENPVNPGVNWGNPVKKKLPNALLPTTLVSFSCHLI